MQGFWLIKLHCPLSSDAIVELGLTTHIGHVWSREIIFALGATTLCTRTIDYSLHMEPHHISWFIMIGTCPTPLERLQVFLWGDY